MGYVLVDMLSHRGERIRSSRHCTEKVVDQNRTLFSIATFLGTACESASGNPSKTGSPRREVKGGQSGKEANGT